jgi:hypothetical protein
MPFTIPYLIAIHEACGKPNMLPKAPYRVDLAPDSSLAEAPFQKFCCGLTIAG